MQEKEQLRTAMQALQAGEFDAAAGLCAAVLSGRPEDVAALHLSGVVALRRGDLPLARKQLEKAGALGGPAAAIDNDLGLVHLAGNNLTLARTYFERALVKRPNRAEFHANLGLTLQKMQDIKGACQAFQHAIAIKPDYAKAFFFMGDLHLGLREPDTARDFFQKAVDLAPAYLAARNHLAICHMETGDLSGAEKELLAAVKIDPDCSRTWCNLGNVQRRTHRFKEALESYRRAVVLKPDFAEAHFNMALVLLLTGEFEAGWQAYEWRLGMFPPGSGYPRRYGLPLWQGQDLAGKTILVYDEQGFGDTFMFCRYLALLKNLGASVVFEVRPALYPLFRKLPSADLVIRRDRKYTESEAWDYCIPLCSLAGRFFHRDSPFPPDTPYLNATAEKQRQWSHRFPVNRFKIGLVWSGSRVDPSRRCPPGLLKPLQLSGRVALYSLQKDDRQNPAAKTAWAIPLGPELTDFSDTAAVLSHLDLLVSIDTAAAHLAGAMGRPVWVLLPHVPDWRWFLDRNDSPWYPTMQLFRQAAPGDWRTPLARIRSALDEMLKDWG